MCNPNYLFVLLALATIVAAASSIFTATTTITLNSIFFGNDIIPTTLAAVTKPLNFSPKRSYNDLSKHLGPHFNIDTTGYTGDTTLPAPNPTSIRKVDTSRVNILVLESDYIISPSHPYYLLKHSGPFSHHDVPTTLETVTTIVNRTPEKTSSILPIDLICPQPVSTSTVKHGSFTSLSIASPQDPTGPILLIPTLNGLLLPAQGSYSNSTSPIHPRGEAMTLQAQAWAATQAAATGQAASSSFWKALRCWAMLALIPRPFQAIPMLTPWCRHALTHESKYAENSAIHNNGTVVVTKTVNGVQSTVSTPITTGTSISNTTEVKFSNITVKYPNTTTFSLLNIAKMNFSNNTMVKLPNTTRIDFSNTTNVAAGRQSSDTRISLITGDPHFKYKHHTLIHASATSNFTTSTVVSLFKLSTLVPSSFPLSSSAEILTPRSPLLHECPEGPYCHRPDTHPFKWFNDQIAKWTKAEWGEDDRIDVGDDSKALKIKTYETNKHPTKPKGYKGGKQDEGKNTKAVVDK